MNKSNIWLCDNCANEGGTVANMQMIVIPDMLKEIDDAKMVLKCAHDILDSSEKAHWKKKIVDNVLAIRRFYNRFPDLKRVQLPKLVTRIEVP